MFKFSISNIGYEQLQNILGLRMEGFLLRLRYVVYAILIVSLTSFPLACLFSIMGIELAHIAMTCYYALKYRYAKNWFLIVSKVNVGIAIVLITSMGMYILLATSNPSSFKNNVNPTIQYIAMILFAFSVVLEFVVLTIDLIRRMAAFIWNYFKNKGKKSKKTFF